MAEIKEGLEEMTVEERQEITSFLVRLELSGDESYWERVRRRSEDRNPEHWVSLQDLSTKSE